MKIYAAAALVVTLACSIYAQQVSKDGKVKAGNGLLNKVSKIHAESTVEVQLLTPWTRLGGNWVPNPKVHQQNQNCVSLVTLQQSCSTNHILAYGDRFGENIDIFHVASIGQQTRMVDLGPAAWDDTLQIPVVEPWAALLPGEIRKVTIDVSGERGRDGASGTPGSSTNGSSRHKISSAASPNTEQRQGYAGKPLSEQVSSSLLRSGKVIKADKYSPFLVAKKGHIYLAHVVDEQFDYYLLIRVDDLVTAQKASLSFRRVPNDLFSAEQ